MLTFLTVALTTGAAAWLLATGEERHRSSQQQAELHTRMMLFVPVKSPEQQSIMVLHKTRQMVMRQRTKLANTIRAHMAEIGIVAPIGRNPD